MCQVCHPPKVFLLFFQNFYMFFLQFCVATTIEGTRKPEFGEGVLLST